MEEIFINWFKNKSEIKSSIDKTASMLWLSLVQKYYKGKSKSVLRQ